LQPTPSLFGAATEFLPPGRHERCHLMSAACRSDAGSTLMTLACLECCKTVLRGTGHVAHGSLKCTHGPCTAAPNGLTVLHAAALAYSAEAVAEALAAATGIAACGPAGSAAASAANSIALDSELDRDSKYSLHLSLESCDIVLTNEKHVSKFYRRLHGCTALEVAVTLGHLEPAAALLAAGAAVRRPGRPSHDFARPRHATACPQCWLLAR
jgi:hypothetical protein